MLKVFNSNETSGLKWIWVAVLTFVLDQASKLWVVGAFELYERVAITPFFNLTYVRNYGAAFSFLSDAGGWQRWFFTAIAFAVSVMLLYWLRKNDAGQKAQNIAFALILGGALGNVIDRLYHGFVVDFLDVYVGSYHWPAFNIADSAICIGAVLLVWDAFTQDSKNKTKAE